MSYVPYADVQYYTDTHEGTAIESADILKALTKASRHIDSLTFNRIVKVGLSNLTAFQRDLVQEVVCELADFEVSNKDMLETYLSSYSINGVSMTFGSNWNLHIENGVAIPRDLYTKLLQTGLCNRTL